MLKYVGKGSTNGHLMYAEFMNVLHPDVVESLVDSTDKHISRAARAHQAMIGT